mmetsp:Transcript_34757/g.108816  ORF Transcript_34757/g.108816 Transcript_34757/m.108816 type:complete len:699 (-) Transcript_34757:114-2210(-)
MAETVLAKTGIVQQPGCLEIDKLNALDAAPLLISIVNFGHPPRNLWANSRYLKEKGLDLQAFIAKDPCQDTPEVKCKQDDVYQLVQVENNVVVERSHNEKTKSHGEVICSPIIFKSSTTSDEGEKAVMITRLPQDLQRQLDSHMRYMTFLLECSPYPMGFFTFDGHLITSNPAAVAAFGDTIWLQSDIFGMKDAHERHGLADPEKCNHQSNKAHPQTERRTAYMKMMEALVEDGSTYEVDIPLKKKLDDQTEETWYCRVFAQRQKDPFTGEPIIMVSHKNVTDLRKVEGELGRMELSALTQKDLIQHDSDVAGSLAVLLGEDWKFVYDNPGRESALSVHKSSEGSSSPRSLLSAVSADYGSSSLIADQLQGLRAVLDTADDWHFNVFDLEREADGLPLQVICWHVFTKHNLIEEFKLDQVKLMNFFRAIESGMQDNPYHNATHVADVVQSMHCLLLKGGLNQFVGKMEILAGLFSACIHDFEHIGFNNDFLIKTQHDWAIDSNDKSPNENHHLISAFRILRQDDFNFLHRMPEAQRNQFRKIVIELVLATDMGEHMAIVSKLKTNLLKRMENPDDQIEDEPPDSLRILVLQGAIKVADIGHVYADRDVHIRWAERLEEEMWRQGDLEKHRDLKVSFLMDREKPGVTRSQPGFVDFVVMPLFETWAACFPKCQVLVNRVQANCDHWKEMEKQWNLASKT